MTFTLAGNVGIGTASPESKLHISESVAGQTGIWITNTQGAAGNTSATAAINFVLQNGAGGSSGFVSLIAGKESDHQSAANVDDFFAIRTTSNDSVTERLRITSGGDVRINFNPGAPNGLYFNDATTSAAMLYIIPAVYTGTAPYNSNRIVAANSSNLSFECGGAERMKVTSGGSVIVGASYMTYPVSIEAQSGGGQLALTRSGAVGEFYMGGTTGGGTVLYVRSGGSGGVYLSAGGVAWVGNSDERLKTDLVPIENGLEKVASLRSVIGRYLTDDEDKKRAFLIAQDVEKVLPEAVVTNEETGDMGVSYTEVIPLLVAAIKELKIEIDSLKNQIK
jgi:hypothetical protein